MACEAGLKLLPAQLLEWTAYYQSHPDHNWSEQQAQEWISSFTPDPVPSFQEAAALDIQAADAVDIAADGQQAPAADMQAEAADMLLPADTGQLPADDMQTDAATVAEPDQQEVMQEVDQLERQLQQQQPKENGGYAHTEAEMTAGRHIKPSHQATA